MINVYLFCNIIRTFVAYVLFITSGRSVRQSVCLDIRRYYTIGESVSWWELNKYLLMNRQCRNIFYYRMKDRKLLSILSKLLLKPMENIEIINGHIGGGLKIQHRSGCVITLTTAGINMNVGQGVTIGVGRKAADGRDTPIIGDNVDICTNAVVIGGITIGNNVVIGAGSVVIHSIPDNVVVAGVPARIIKSIK